MNINFPYHIDALGRTASTGSEGAEQHSRHLRDMIDQVLFTTPGERVNRPEFGSGLLQMVFAPNSVELATATQFLIQGALQRYLGDLITVESVTVESEDATLRVTVAYTVRRTQQRQVDKFSRAVTI